jgi:hypothetical protein
MSVYASNTEVVASTDMSAKALMEINGYEVKFLLDSIDSYESNEEDYPEHMFDAMRTLLEKMMTTIKEKGDAKVP